MRILITVFTFPPHNNGVANMAYQHALGFMRNGHKVTVATSYEPTRNRTLFPAGLEIVEFNLEGNANIRTRYRGEISKYLDFISGFSGDIICCHCWQIWSTDLAVKRFNNVRAKKILISHGVSANSKYEWPRQTPSWLLWRPYVWLQMPRILEAFDHVVLLSNRLDMDRFYDNYLIKKLNYNEVSIIPNGVDLGMLQKGSIDFRQKYGLDGQFLLLCVGKFSKEKNEEMLVDAFINARVKDTTLVLIGPRKNPYCLRLEKLWDKHKGKSANKKLMILEDISIDEIASAYRAADLYLNGSKTEYFPFVILEAMAFGTPYISTDVGCISDLPGGITIKSVNEMAERIVYMFNNTQLRKILGDEGRKACAEKYNLSNVINNYENLFAHVVN